MKKIKLVKQICKCIRNVDSSYELKDTKNCMYYYFDDIIKIKDFNLDYFLIDMKEHIKIFYFITFHTKS